MQRENRQQARGGFGLGQAVHQRRQHFLHNHVLAAVILNDLQAARAEAETLKQELQSLKIAAGDRLTEAEALRKEAEAIRADAENRRRQMLALASAPLAATPWPR